MDNQEKKETRGRKAEEQGASKTKLITAKISEKDYQRIEEMADYLNIPRMTLTRNFILNGIDDAELLKKVGILSIVKNVKKTNDFLKKFKSIKKEIVTEK